MKISPSDGVDSSSSGATTSTAGTASTDSPPSPGESESGGLLSKGPFKLLMQSEGGRPLSEVEEEYGCGRGTALVIRGCMKLAEASSFPALADIVGGVLMLSKERGEKASSGDDSGGWQH